MRRTIVFNNIGTQGKDLVQVKSISPTARFSLLLTVLRRRHRCLFSVWLHAAGRLSCFVPVVVPVVVLLLFEVDPV